MGTSKALRIAIIGAGPSGLSLAWYFKQLGFRSVEIFEAANDVGGQSHTVDVGGIPIEMGTCYLTDGYVIAREIARAAGAPAARLPRSTFLDQQGQVVVPAQPAALDTVHYIWKWLGWFFAGQLWNPTRPDNALDFTAWLQSKGLGHISQEAIFTACCTAQLYGPLNAISAHNGLSWVRPSLLLTAKREGTAHIPAGFQNMWRRVVAQIGYPVHFGNVVDEVRPVRDGDVTTVEVRCAGAPDAVRFDHAFIACPLDATRADGTAAPRHPLTDLLRERHAPFDSTEVYSGVWCASHWPLAAASRCYLPAATSGERGRLLTIRQCGKVGEEWVGQICAYTPEDAPADPDARLRANRAQMVKDMETIVGLRNIRIVKDRLWRYNVRYSAGQLREGLPAVITQRQGVEHVWYAGGGLSHWDVDMIANFSQSLAWRFAKRAGLSLFARLRIVRLRDLVRDL